MVDSGRSAQSRLARRADPQPPGAHLSVALVRLGQGNASPAKPVGEGVLEYRIDWGPGYRVYFGRDGETLVILLTGGTKQRQQRDIERAKELWTDYRRRRKPPAR
jgi:putative addiction module killer protein